MNSFLKGCAVAIGLIAATTAVEAATVEVIGGTTNVTLQQGALDAAGLGIAGASASVGVDASVPGAITASFPINGPDVTFPQRPSTLSYDPDDLSTLSGTIEHTGFILFDPEGIVAGNFTIRPGGPEGFEVVDNVGILAGTALFDATVNNVDVGQPGRLVIEGDLKVSQAFADVLADTGLTTAALGGALAGSFVTEAVVTPLPGAFVLAGTALAGLGLMRRRQQQRAKAEALPA